MALKLTSVGLSGYVGHSINDITAFAVVDGKVVGGSAPKELPERPIAEEDKPNRFAQNKPRIMFISDYIVEDQQIGILIVFERYFNATHYEIFKKNKFDNEPKFERILFLDTVSLEQETKRFLPFLDTIGFSLNESGVFIILDTSVKKDRIYEFFVRAGRVPTQIEEVDFVPIMINKDMAIVTEAFDNSTIKSISLSFFGRADFSWIVALLNKSVPFFGKEIVLSVGQKIVVSKSFDDKLFMKLINDFIYLFGIKKVLTRILFLLGGTYSNESGKESGRLNGEISSAFSDSIDDSNGMFSFDVFKATLLEKSNFFKLLSDSGNELTQKTGKISFSSLNNLSQIFNYLQVLDFTILQIKITSDAAAVAASLSAASAARTESFIAS